MSATADEPVLRDAGRDDLPALAALHVAAFRETHGGGPSPAIREAQWREKFGSDRLLFCIVLEEPGGALVGFASGEPHDRADGLPYDGELTKFYLLRAYHRRGLGRRLLCAASERFLERHVSSMLLFGDAASPSNGFYEAMGGERLHSSTGEFHGGYGWRDLATLASRCRP